MSPLSKTESTIFFIFLLFISSVQLKDVQKSGKEIPKDSDVKPVEEIFEESSSEDEFSLQSATTTESTTTIETYRKLTLSISGKNDSSKFKPSVHLGEIKESRISTGPFNNLHHFKFDSGVDPTSYHEHLKDFQVVFQPTVQTIPADYQANIQQNLFESAIGSVEEGKRDGMEQNYIKFQDDPLDASRLQYGNFKDQYSQQLAHSVTENLGAQYNLADQQVFQNLEKPVFDQQTTAYLGKPSKFQGEAQKHEVAGLSSTGPSETPYYAGFYDYHNHQPGAGAQDLDLFRKPSNGVVYVQESSFMRTRKFPYPIYQPPSGYHQLDLVKNDHPNYSVRKRISPWKKILHLIGTFLPLGLLVAALTPNIVKVDNATQPNIVLSKWRVADLPVEHKQARFTRFSNDRCEERSICEIILAGSGPGSSALQGILWNLATRTSPVMAKESGLQEIFEAAKKKDCATVPC